MKRGLSYSLLILCGFVLTAQSVKIEKRFTESFPVSKSDLLTISNKYGDVIVHVWERDTVQIKALVIAESKTQELANREIARVDIAIRKTGNIISALTKVDPGKRGSIGELVSQVEDYSKTMLGGNRLTASYEIYIPAYLNITLDNKFGDIYLDMLKGKVDITLAQGDLRANDLSGQFFLKQTFGKHYISHVNEGNLNLRAVKSQILTVNQLTIESGTSEFQFDQVKRLTLNSRNDKYKIGSADYISGKTSFTDITLNELNRTFETESSYGNLIIYQTAKQFDQIHISAKMTDVRLALDQSSYVKTKIVGNEQRMVLPNAMMVLPKETYADGRIALTGFAGNTHQHFGSVNLDVLNGQIVISILQTDIFTNKK